MAANYTFTYSDVAAACGGKLHHDNTFVSRDFSGYVVRLYAAEIAKLTDLTIMVNAGGWRTATTRARLNSLLRDYGYTLYAEDGTWYVRNYRDRTEGPIQFTDGLVLERVATED